MYDRLIPIYSSWSHLPHPLKIVVCVAPIDSFFRPSPQVFANYRPYKAMPSLIPMCFIGMKDVFSALSCSAYTVPSSEHRKTEVDCNLAIEITQQEFFRGIFEIDHSKRYIIVTSEDVAHSRSIFSPLTYPTTELDQYEKSITKLLFSHMKALAASRGAQFKAFYPIREDFDVLGRSIQCVRTKDGQRFQYLSDFRSLLGEVISEEDLITFSIQGRNENVVSKYHRHFSVTGNNKAMKQLAAVVKSLEPISKWLCR